LFRWEKNSYSPLKIKVIFRFADLELVSCSTLIRNLFPVFGTNY
jgi:hypothetical protein